MEAEIITIGDELLIGQTIDTNSAYFGQQLGSIGISISRRTAVSDKESAILSALSEAFSRVDLVIMTGGLGPTKDDITKKTLCQYYQCGYRRDEAVLSHLESLFASRGRLMLETNKVQADVPESCETLHNAVGTAPGMWFDHQGKVLISLPGVPGEVYHLTEERVIPRLKSKFPLPTVEHRTLITLQKAESLLSRQLETFEASLPPHLSLAYLPSFNMVKLRLSQVSNSGQTNGDIDEYFSKLQASFPEDVFCLGDIDPALYLSNYLIKNNIRFTTAESCTGGWVAHRLMQAPGISAVYPGSLVAYANDVKQGELGVDPAIIEAHGAVSEACALAMAKGALKKFQVDLAIATTGIAGPGGGTKEKPVGLVYIAVATNDAHFCKPFRLFGNREQIIQRSSNAALWMVKQLLKLPSDPAL
ncbi:MAG: CinA family nicotinamide mononucleotide deamidase-related protein [Bacteroidota bacterium]